jgi:hypothetical protein
MTSVVLVPKQNSQIQKQKPACTAMIPYQCNTPFPTMTENQSNKEAWWIERGKGAYVDEHKAKT